MSLLVKSGTSAELAAVVVRSQAMQLATVAKVYLTNIKAEVAKAGRANVAAALGAADAAELVAFYNKATAMLAAVGETVEDLPA